METYKEPSRYCVKNRLRPDPTSPQNYRSRAHALGRRAENEADTAGEVRHALRWFKDRRPYLASARRRNLLRGTQRFVRGGNSGLEVPRIVHVDFAPEEINVLRDQVRLILATKPKKKDLRRDPRTDLNKLLDKCRSSIPVILDAVERDKLLPHRQRQDVEAFLRDIAALSHKEAREPLFLAKKPTVLALEKDDRDKQGSFVRSSRVHSLLFAREVSGRRAMRCLTSFPNEFRKCREDDLELRTEWTNCAGDISTIVWVNNDKFICGTTEHSDAHNQQYNKPGNLVLGSCVEGTLRALPHHRIPRPVVDKGENSTVEMRESQDPWLYTSVVSSDYDVVHDRAYTSGFDRTVKIWRVGTDKATATDTGMKLLGEWNHAGNVNFVVASKHASGMVATAADVPADAVRIYNVNDSAISQSSFRSLSCSRVQDEFGNTVSTEKWAYFPATMKWGCHEQVSHLLLVGYSPRSRTNDDADIPEERRNTGELCLWDGVTGERWKITSATTQNIFEVLWHPTQPSFIAATSPATEVDDRVRTQIRVFRASNNEEFGGKAFSQIQGLDCSAVDINELTIM